MQEQQQQLYRLIKNSNHSNRASDCNKIACHPKLFDAAYPILGSSGKFDVAIKLLQQIVLERKEKVVMFCIYKGIIELMCEMLDEKQIKYLTLTGDCSASERQRNIRMFQDEDLWIKCPVMFCSYPVGGQGVTLTAANHVILFTPPSSYALTKQATDRYVLLLTWCPTFYHFLV